MADTKDEVAQAVASNRRLAASRLVRQQELEAALTELRIQREEAAIGVGPEADRLGVELDALIAAASTELAGAKEEVRSALAEIAELKRLAATARALPVEMDDDYATGSAEEVALDNVRAHISELDAQARLIDELDELEPASKSVTLSTEVADAQAQARFQELRQQRATPAPGKDDPPASPPRKKTL